MEIEVKGDVLTIVVPLNGPRTQSASGKTWIVGTTHGFTRLPNGMSLSLNVVAKDQGNPAAKATRK